MSEEVITIEDARLILVEVRKDPVAMSRLQDKQRWEHMSSLGVIMDWGDPRMWDD